MSSAKRHVPKNPEDMSIAPAGWYKNPAGREVYRWWDGERWTNNVANEIDSTDLNLSAAVDDGHSASLEAASAPSESAYTDSEPVPSEADNLPAIKDWKTSVGFSILGAVAGIVFWWVLLAFSPILLMLIVGDAWFDISGGMRAPFSAGLAGAVMAVLEIVYAVAFYLSYFKDSPRLRSSKAISFCNFFFGGGLFGALWNRNLTRSHIAEKRIKGISYIYFLVFSILRLCACLVSVATMSVYVASVENQSASYSSNLAVSEDSETNVVQAGVSQDREYVDEAAGVSFTIPAGWVKSRISGDTENYSVVAVLYPDIDPDEVSIAICYAPFGYPPALYDSLTAEDIVSLMVGEDDGSVALESVEKEAVGNAEYWVLSGTTSEDGDGFSYVCLTLQNDALYMIELFDRSGGAGSDDYYADFLRLVSSMKYE